MHAHVILPDSREVGTGWLPPLPDLRDYTECHPSLQETIKRLGIDDTAPLPEKADLRRWCGAPAPDQGSLGACTAHAAAAIIEYFQNRAFGKHFTAARLFIYKNARNLQGLTGDQGSYIRDTMGALALCGVPPERYWPYTDTVPDFDKEPTSFVYAIADNYEALQYFCHDPAVSGRCPRQRKKIPGRRRARHVRLLRLSFLYRGRRCRRHSRPRSQRTGQLEPRGGGLRLRRCAENQKHQIQPGNHGGAPDPQLLGQPHLGGGFTVN